jgi:hypothetical protein
VLLRWNEIFRIEFFDLLVRVARHLLELCVPQNSLPVFVEDVDE